MILFFGISLGILVLVSAFFSAAETALVSLSPQKAKSLALRTPHLKDALEGWLIRPHEILTLILIGNTFVNVLFASLVTVALGRVVTTSSELLMDLYAWLMGTFIIVIVGEMMPKFLARSYPERTSLVLLPWLSRLRLALAPALAAVMKPLTYFFPPLNVPPIGSVMTFSLEELKSLMEEEPRGSAPQDESMEMVQRALDLHNQTADKIMTPLANVDLIELDPPGKPPRPTEFLIDLIVEDGHTRTPVKKNGRLIGFIHCNDLLPFLITRSTDDLLKLVRPASPVSFDRRVADLLHDFRQNGIHMGFVQNSQGEVIGIVTLEDVLEELTGEILDEYDVQPTSGASA